MGDARREVEGEGYNLAQASAALVYDNAVFGYTATADYRRYFLLGPSTFAVRGLHYGRYGRETEGVFSSLFLGYPSLVRGYSGVYNNCVAGLVYCAVLTQTIGSRLAVANAELRIPLISRATLDSRVALPSSRWNCVLRRRRGVDLGNQPQLRAGRSQRCEQAGAADQRGCRRLNQRAGLHDSGG